MARPVPRLVAVGITIAFAISGGSDLTLSTGRGQTEPGMELNRKKLNGRKLFERETFGGNGRTCLTCHSKAHGHAHHRGRAADHRKGGPRRPFLDSRRARRRRGRHDAGPEARTIRSPSHCRRGSRWRMTRARRTSAYFAVSVDTEHASARPGSDARRTRPNAAAAGTRRHPRPYPERRRTDASRARCHRGIPANRPAVFLLGCAQKVRRRWTATRAAPWTHAGSRSEDACSLSTRPSPRLQRTASVLSVMAVRC